jgi:hypothetical protein
MYFHAKTQFLAFLLAISRTRAIADAQITPRALNPYLQARQPQVFSTITSAGPFAGLQFCFGDGSICDYSVSLYKDCASFQNDQNQSKWYQCICLNGYVAVNQQ